MSARPLFYMVRTFALWHPFPAQLGERVATPEAVAALWRATYPEAPSVEVVEAPPDLSPKLGYTYQKTIFGFSIWGRLPS